MTITILREPNAQGVREPDQVDESLLVRTDTREEDDERIVEAVEYRFPGSDVIVHRSCHVTVKRWPVEAAAETQSLV